MSPNLTSLLQPRGASDDFVTKPLFYRLRISSDKVALEKLLLENPNIRVKDELRLQLRDLVKLEHPRKTLTDAEYERLIKEKVGSYKDEEYGVWVFYPWRSELIHILDEAEFVKVRTVRNAYKITFAEQQILQTKKVGIIGLSVGQSAALAIALERVGGEIRIADYDHLELSNLNRIRTGLYNLGIPKTTLVAREIAEIDPYLNVSCFHDGINPDNIDSFLCFNGPIDILIEECDSVEIKILAREHCKRLKIPVVMDTSDRGMLDVERYDQDENLPILHGLVDSSVSYDFLKSLKSSEEKLPYIVPILGIETMSVRMKSSALEVGQSITTWPQLAGDVILGGALCTYAARQILLGGKLRSQRIWCDISSFLNSEEDSKIPTLLGEESLSDDELKQELNELPLLPSIQLDKSTIDFLLNNAIKASSPGNTQKWKWVLKKDNLFLFLDKREETGFSDNFSFGSYVGFGMSLENLKLSALSKGFHCKIHAGNNKTSKRLIAQLTFHEGGKATSIDKILYDAIQFRTTDRAEIETFELSGADAEELQSIKLNEKVGLKFIDRSYFTQIANLIRKADRYRLSNLFGHQDFFNNEIRWDEVDNQLHKDGVDVRLLELTPKERIGIEISKDIKAVDFLNSFNGGQGFETLSDRMLKNPCTIGVVSIPGYSRENLINAGVDIARVWLKATSMNLSIHPMTALQMLFSYLHSDSNHLISDSERKRIQMLKNEFDKIVPELVGMKSIFMFRIFPRITMVNKSLRKPLSEKLFIAD